MIESLLQQAKKEGKMILLDFSAPWCGTCPAVDKVIENDVLPGNEEKLLLVKVDIEYYPEIAEEYDILSVPTVILLSPEKEVIWRHSGLIRKEELLKKL